MSTQIDFVKGHCGWDTVTLLVEGQIPASDELTASIKILSAPIDGGLEVGWMGAGNRPNEIRLRMVSATTRNWISMCGGMSQVIGKALVETFLRDRFKIETSQPVLAIHLVTASGEIPIEISIHDGRVSEVVTTMDSYVDFLRRKGCEDLSFQGIPVKKVGPYAIMDLARLEKFHPEVDFTRRDPGRHLDLINNVLRAFGRHVGASSVNGMLYDDRPEGPGQFRVFPRFYSEDLVAARIPWEFQCGTGSVAVAMALALEGRLSFAAEKEELLFEWGSFRTTHDPYGIRTSRLRLERNGTRVTRASFSHSVVEVLAEGKLTLPEY